MERLKSVRDHLLNGENPKEEKKDNYIPLDLDVALGEHGKDFPTGESCRIDLLKEVMAWMRGFVHAWYGWPSAGKMEWIENLLPTPGGFKRMGDIKIGDILFDEMGNRCKVIFTTPIQLKKKCFRVHFDDGNSVICGGEHLWLTYDSTELRSRNTRLNRTITKPWLDQSLKRKKPKVRSTFEISKTLVGRGGRVNHAVQLAKPFIGEYKNLLIPPYILGAWLGDGHSAGGGFTGIDEQILEEIRSFGFEVSSRGSRKQDHYIRNLIQLLRKVGVLNNKHIPVDYLFSSKQQRLELLQGLMDTDGCCMKTGSCEFCSCNEILANDVYILISSLGIKCHMTKSDAKLYGRKTSNRYRINFKTTEPIFKLKRKLNRLPKRVDPSQHFRYIIGVEPIESVPCKCIQVSSPRQLYLTSKSFIPTHNTTWVSYLMMVKSIRDDWKWGIYSPEEMNATIEDKKLKIKADKIYWNLAWIYSGKPWNKTFAERNNCQVMTKEEEREALEFVTKHFFVIHPKERKITSILENMDSLNSRFGLMDGFLIDPWNVVDIETTKRSDEMLTSAFIDVKQFAMLTNSCFNIISHPRSLKEVKVSHEKHSPYKVVNQFMQSGGAPWNNKMDSQYSIERPNSHLQPLDPFVNFHNLKQRDFEAVGANKGTVGDGEQKIEFDFKKRRYYFDGVDIISGELKSDLPF